MRRSTFNYIKEILKDYPDIEKHIQRRKEELRYPYRQNDLNADIKGKGNTFNAMDNLMITIDQDRRLAALERNRNIIDDNLQRCDRDTNLIIQELYIKRYPTYTMKGLIDNNLIFCSLRKAYDLRNEFFNNVADDLGLDK